MRNDVIATRFPFVSRMLACTGFRGPLAVTGLILAAAAFGACREITGPTAEISSNGAEAVVSSPTVTVVPVSGATGVATDAGPVLTFSQTMDLATINNSTVTLTVSGGGAGVAGVLSFHGNNKVLFDPIPVLATGTTYVLTVTTGVQDVGGTPMAAQFTTSFTTTGPAPDVTAPTVTSTSPANNTVNVAVGSTVSATFSEAMNAGTVTGSSVTLTPTAGGAAIPAAFNYNAASRIATLTPSSSLAFSTSYTLTVSTAVQDVAGNALAATFSSTFTTDAGDVTAPTVTGVTPATGASGVAATSNVVVTFSEPMIAGTVNTSTYTVTPTSGGAPIAAGVVYNAGPRTATLTPSAALSYSTSYTVNVTSGATDAAGNALTPFSSTFTTAAAPAVGAPVITSTTPANGATGIATSDGVIFRFNETMDLATINTSNVSLAVSGGGAAVPGVLSFHGNNVVLFDPTPTLAAGTTYAFTVSTGVQDAGGTPMAAQFTTSFTTTGPAPDVTAPTVTSVNPINSATNVAIATNVTVSFSEAMNAATVGGTTFTLTPTSGGAAVPASVLYTAGTTSATLNPSSDLAYSTAYSVAATGGATDAAGNPLTAFNSTFTTAAAPDLTPPTVTVVQPANGATNVATNANVTVTFSEAMNASSINSSSFTLALTSGGSISGSVGYDPFTNVATFTPASPLANSTSFTVTVSTSVRDVAGNFLASAFTSSFSTVAPADVAAPTVTSTSPANRASEISVTSAVRVTFNEPINPATLTPSTFTVREISGTGSSIDGTRTYDAATNTAIFTPAAPLKNYRNYTVTVAPGVSDVAGNQTASPFSSCFTPTAGAGVADILEQDHWAGNDACGEVHWHVPLARSGNTLTRALSCGTNNINCNISAVSEAGRAVLGGASCRPSSLGFPRLCEVEIATLNGTVNGTLVSFTLTTDNGLTFSFNGAFAASDTGTPWLVGTLTGATMAPIGINWERQS